MEREKKMQRQGFFFIHKYCLHFNVSILFLICITNDFHVSAGLWLNVNFSSFSFKHVEKFSFSCIFLFCLFLWSICFLRRILCEFFEFLERLSMLRRKGVLLGFLKYPSIRLWDKSFKEVLNILINVIQNLLKISNLKMNCEVHNNLGFSDPFVFFVKKFSLNKIYLAWVCHTDSSLLPILLLLNMNVITYVED